jgi:MFS family permease
LKSSKTGVPVTIWNRNFICILLISFILAISHFAINPLIASYALHLGASAHIMGLLTGLFFGVAFSMRPVSGPVLTKFDKRKLMILVFFIGGVANIVTRFLIIYLPLSLSGCFMCLSMHL